MARKTKHQNANWVEQSPVEPRADHSGYFPNTEYLGPDEMRVIILGSGMPNARKSQASASILVELGNGDKFIFDIGSESVANLGSLEIPYDWLDKVFITHLHQDHFADLLALWIGGWTGGRHGPLRVWGPNSDKPELGTKAAIEGFRASMLWDVTSRMGEIPAGGGELEVHEFDYRGENAIVYNENDVIVRSFPAVHAIDGSVSYSLEWNGLKFVFGGDTYPKQMVCGNMPKTPTSPSMNVSPPWINWLTSTNSTRTRLLMLPSMCILHHLLLARLWIYASREWLSPGISTMISTPVMTCTNRSVLLTTAH